MDLIQEIMKQVGVDETQAKGGAGALFKVAQDKLDGADFSKLAGAIPGIDDLIKSVPSGSGMSGMLGGLAKSFGGADLGSLAALVGSLSSLNLDKDTLSKFLPVILSYLKDKGLGDIVEKIVKAIPSI